MLKFKKSEQEFIRAIVKNNSSVTNIATALNKSKLLEKKGIAIIPWPSRNDTIIFYDKSKYGEDSQEPVGYICEIISLLDLLLKERLIIKVPLRESKPCMIGRQKSKWYRENELVINNGEEIVGFFISSFYWKKNKKSLDYFPEWGLSSSINFNQLFISYSVSQELRELVNNGFKSIDEIRFGKQQTVTWISICVAIFIGLSDKILDFINYLFKLWK